MITLANKQKGIGLIELMISMALGLFLISGAISVFISSKQSYSLNSEMSWIQDNVRFASITLNRELRMAGYFGCGTNTAVSSTLNNVAGTGWWLDFEKAVLGWDGDDAAYPTAEFDAAYNSNSAPALPSSDIISLRRANDPEIYVEDSGPDTSAPISLVGGNHPFEDGDILVISDCKQSTIIQNTSNTNTNIVHNTSGSRVPGNCTKNLGPLRCISGPHVNEKRYTEQDGAVIMKIVAYAFFIKNASDGTPTLYRKRLKTESGDATVEDEELIQGIENMQAFYGVDTNADGFANHYLDAEDVPAADWNNVVSMRVHLLFRSMLQVTTEPQVFRFAGSSYTPADRFLRQEIISTIQIRNKG